MKIQSHDLKLQSQHTFSQTYEETEFSFKTFLQPVSIEDLTKTQTEKPLDFSMLKLQDTRKIEQILREKEQSSN